MAKPFILNGHGTRAYWGVTPATDLNELRDCSRCDDEEKENWNFLVCYAADCRDILKTLGNARATDDQRHITFYVLNPTIENTARDILLLSVALESSDILGLRGKTETFLELYGNLKIREATKSYLVKKCDDLIRLITKDPVSLHGSEIFDFTHLKYSDRDDLEKLFKTWMNPDKKINLEECWDARLRRDLETRYDTRLGAFDWDFTMKLTELGGAMITSPTYFRWRETGMAFEPREDISYVHPNPTLVSSLSVSRKDTSQNLPGYWGDMLTSPYIGFGLGEDAVKYRKVCNNVETVSSAVISESVLLDYLHLITDGMGSTVAEKNEMDQVDTSHQPRHPWISSFKIIFLSPGSFSKISQKQMYQGLFDLAYISGHGPMSSISDLKVTVRHSRIAAFESPKFLIGLNKNRCSAYHQFFSTKMPMEGFKAMGNYNENNDYHFRFIKSDNVISCQNENYD